MGRNPYSAFFVLASFSIYAEAATRRPLKPQTESLKLFVFGDSYADTGNSPYPTSAPWKEPYGITYPGKPSGRFSDGRILTDYVAAFLGIRSPLPYQWKNFEAKSIQCGINFAHGGTGVFTTLVDEPNMTTQIDFFHQLIEEKVYTRNNLSSSIGLVSLAGNDYATYLVKNGSLEGLPEFTKSVIDQLVSNLRRIIDLGVRKVAVTGIEPVGCLPRRTVSSSYQNCSSTENSLLVSHNQLLQQNLEMLNNGSHDRVFVYLDLYKAFTAALKLTGNRNFENPLRPCCLGFGDLDSCGSVDANGRKRYVVCDHPKHSFFWDSIHPSDKGWRAVYSSLKTSLHALL